MIEALRNEPPNPAEGRPHGKFLIKRDGEQIGFIEYSFHTDPFPFFYFRDFIIDDKEDRGNRNKGYGREALLQLNAFLMRENKMGIGFDATVASPAMGMYERHGWQTVPSFPGFVFFNVPKDFDGTELQKQLANIALEEKRTA